MNHFERYNKAINYLESLSNMPLRGDYMADKNHAEVYIKRMRYFLNLIGNPDRDLRIIHIAGTSGKGTVTNMVHEILNVSDKKVGSFTSPFATTSIEKIKVNEKFISPDEFSDVVEYLKPFIDEAYIKCPYGRPSYFEIFFAVALIYFAKQKCEYVILEVGLGGRYDSTNVVEKPIITAITNIDYDHTELLGRTLEKIAFDKAGIIKRGSEFFTTEQRPSLLKVFGGICYEKHVSMQALPRQDGYKEYNRVLATTIARSLGVGETDIVEGVNKARLPCRFEIMEHKPIVVLDGAHNRAKIKATIYNLGELTFKELFLIIGIANNKNHISILKQVIPKADYVFFTRFQNKDRQCAHPKELLKKSKKYLKKGVCTKIYLDLELALRRAREKATRDDLILVAGSFYLAGELRKHWFPEDWILKHRRSFR